MWTNLRKITELLSDKEALNSGCLTPASTEVETAVWCFLLFLYLQAVTHLTLSPLNAGIVSYYYKYGTIVSIIIITSRVIEIITRTLMYRVFPVWPELSILYLLHNTASHIEICIIFTL